MTLPDFLEKDDVGFVHLSRHRVGLHHVVRMYSDGSSPEMIAAYYPSLPLALVHKVIGFYLENQNEVDSDVAAHDLEISSQITAGRKAPSIVELRRRLQHMTLPLPKSG